MTQPRIVVYVSPTHDLVHTSKVLAGFCALADRKAADVQFRRPSAPDRWLAADPVVVCFDMDRPIPARVALDLRDGEGVSQPILDRVSVYFKRAWYRPEVAALRPALGSKILPFGLNYGCRSVSSTIRSLKAVGLPMILEGSAGIRKLRQFLKVPTTRHFEQGPDTPVEPRVAFQTRLWTADETVPEEVEPINADRVSMVRALRKAFGNRFVGGLVPTPFARRHFPAEVTPHSSEYSQYLALKKQCLIGVYTRGIEHSLAFKLGETFAASLCLVSVALRYDVPQPISAGRHYLPFESPEGCIEACQVLFDNPEQARAMRHANHEYYVTAVEPAAHMTRLLERVAAHGAAGSTTL